MRGHVRTAIAAVVTIAGLVLPGLPAAWADTAVSQAITALKSARVYDAVPPGADVPPEAVATITDRLNNMDGLFVALFPAGSVQPTTASSSIAEGLGGRKVVLVIAGNAAAASTTLVPASYAATALTNALSVTTNPVDLAMTFVDDIHDYQSTHPAATVKTVVAKPKSTQPQQKGSNPLPFLLVIAVILGSVIAISVVDRSRRNRRNSAYGTEHGYGPAPAHHKLPDPPGRIPGLIREITKEMAGIRNGKVRSDLATALENISELFARLRELQSQGAKDFTHTNLDEETRKYADRLQNLLLVVENYVYVLENRDRGYVKDPDKYIAQGERSFNTFAANILAAIRAANEGRLFDFEVTARLLDRPS